MKLLSFTALSIIISLTSFTIAQETNTVTAVDSPSSTSTLPDRQAGPTDQNASPSPTEASSSSSVVQATQIQSQDPSAIASVAPTYSNNVDVEGGASGSDSSSFKLSKGGLIAIVIVVVCAALFGIASIVLFVIAKRRQWTMRQTLKRASRRLTGRGNRQSEADRRKRSGVVAGSKKGGTTVGYPPGQKRSVAVEVKDIEKGQVSGKTTNPRRSAWLQKLQGNNWQ